MEGPDHSTLREFKAITITKCRGQLIIIMRQQNVNQISGWIGGGDQGPALVESWVKGPTTKYGKFQD